MKKMYIKNLSSLEKVFPEMTCIGAEHNRGSMLLDEEYAYQIAIKAYDGIGPAQLLEMEVCSDISECISLYNVRCVPVLLNRYYQNGDNNYISDKPGVFPDILDPYVDYVMMSEYYYTAVWVNIKTDERVKPGIHEIRIVFKCNGEVYGESVFNLEVIDAVLPKTDIPYTDWFHCDCISSYYDCEPLSDRHWDLIDKYMATASENGINMILTPIFTLPLDTAVGKERPTVQLVDAKYDDGKYSFGFDKLIKWLELCKKNNFEYIEISHLYSQWGAEHTPKIVVTENGKEIKKFGWETDSMGEEYKTFISQLIPPLKEVLAKYWDEEKVYFHISDEPYKDHIEHYGDIYRFIKPLIGDFKQIDALSNYEMYEKGFIHTPVVATNHINDFINNKVSNIWAYYCCSQGGGNLSNRFIAMPSYRNRIIGIQLYKYDIKGFLHWGYNFYYSRFSHHLINPYLTNDSEISFPAGDAFGVYPAKDGAIPSLRIKVFKNALGDMMAFKLLEKYIGKEAVMKILEHEGEIDFNSYPDSSQYIIDTREIVNSKIKDCIKRKECTNE